jgi:hypothetical protein
MDDMRQSYQLKIRNSDGLEIGSITIAAQTRFATSPFDNALHTSSPVEADELVLFRHGGWTAVILENDNSSILVSEPGVYTVFEISGDGEVPIGAFNVAFSPTPPLTSDRISAIRSDPNASQFVKAEIGCQKCPDKYKVYLGLEQSSSLEQQGYKWSPSLTDTAFRCSCGSTTISLAYIDSGLRAILGNPTTDEQVALIPLYEQSSLRRLRQSFLNLLNSDPEEEKVQKFFTENPVMLHSFSARRLIPKPPIGVKHVADFGIWDARGDLLLLEIEKPATKLLRKNGHRTQHLVHAFEQVNDWMRKIEEHRQSVLDDLGLDPRSVSSIRGVVIAGRDSGCDAAHLRDLKKRPNDGIHFLTYDDVLGSIDTLIQRMEAR